MTSRQLLKTLGWLAFAALLIAFAGVGTVYVYLAPKLPSIESLRDVRLQVPLRVYSRERALIAEFGEKRRIPVRIGEVPKQLVDAILAAEDDRFFHHPGVDYQGLIRAGIELLRTGEKRQGGSTITMQVARNFFLSSEKTYLRKLNEILLALKIESGLSKDEILELYLNKIYFGQRAYGVGAAAQIYYGKRLDELSLAEIATLAGLPKAPSRDNPISNPERALERRNYVLGRMRDLGMIDAATLATARTAPRTAMIHELPLEVDAPYVAEMVRRELIDRYGDQAYTEGFSVVTTIDRHHQQLANGALRTALIDYDRRHGYRGAERPAATATSDLAQLPAIGGLVPARVTAVDEMTIQAVTAGDEPATIDADGWSWARSYLSENRRGPPPKRADELVAPGDIIRLGRDEAGGWTLAQLPELEGAFVAIRPGDGAISALVGGFDFRRSKFNRVTQARRQPGSGFKPVIYSAALDRGYTPATLINDAPVVFDDPSLEATWRPENYSGKFYGPTRLRVALINSRNLVSIRLLQAIGVDVALDYAARFGLDSARLPRNLSLALGSGSVTPLEMAAIYAVFANGGHRVTPYFIERIEDGAGVVIEQANPAFVCPQCSEENRGGDRQQAGDAEVATADPPAATRDLAAMIEAAATGGPRPAAAQPPGAVRLAPRILESRNAYLMYTLLRDVVRFGTARRAMELKRSDLAGKTGTTNDQRDAWFNGFNLALAGIAWVGFDDFKPLGDRETGGRAALPMWMAFMAEALAGLPQIEPDEPPGLARVRIDPVSGLLAAAGQDNAIFELFKLENRPLLPSANEEAVAPHRTDSRATPPEQLF